MNKIIHGDCLEKLKDIPDNSIDAVITDPPYGLSFMGKKWDYDVPSIEIWKECYRVLKHGGYLLSFAGTRTQHRMAVRIEDAGFEIRDMIAWVYGSGFPKSLNIGKAVDKLQGNEREDLGEYDPRSLIDGANRQDRAIGGQQVAPSETSKLRLTKGTSEWEGWGTALKPALEPITVARKPLSEKTIAKNCLKWGVGGINIDECRVEIPEGDNSGWSGSETWNEDSTFTEKGKCTSRTKPSGRFPANLIHDGSEEVRECFPETKVGARKAGQLRHTKDGDLNFTGDTYTINDYPANEGNASRFFYCAKASKSERNMGCDELEEGEVVRQGLAGEHNNPTHKNNHPTVKPIKLMEYLVKLVSKENAVVLDPFAGSGSTLIACKNLNRQYIGIEMEEDYIKIAEARLNGTSQ